MNESKDSALTAGWRISGYVDLRDAPVVLPSNCVSPDSVRSTGLEVSWRGGRVQVLAEGAIVVASMGAPRFGKDTAGNHFGAPPEAAAWRSRYTQYGTNCVDGVKGPFAMILVDLGARRVMAATDRFGICPLCYSLTDGVFAFSDRADFVPIRRSREIDPQALLDYFYFHVAPAPRTIFRRVQRLDLAHCVVGTLDGEVVRRYWRPSFIEATKSSFPELKQQFRRLLETAVGQELTGEPVGAFLSGGTDSSTVVGLLSKAMGSAVRSFSIGFEAEGYDEVKYARIAARHFGADHHEYYVTPEDLIEIIPAVAQHYDQPFGNSSALPAFCCARMAKKAGVGKLLAGDGGDELFGGNVRYAKQRLFEAYRSVPLPIREGIVEPVLGSTLAQELPLVRKAASYVQQARTLMPARLNAYNLLLRLGVDRVLGPLLIERVNAEAPAAQERAFYQDCDATSLVNRMLAFDWKYTLADNDLPKVRETSGLAGLNVGFPMLSHELVDFSLGLPPRYKVRGLRLRWFFKEALRDFLPQEIVRKKKHGFGLPFGVWVARHAGLFDFAAEAARALARRGIVRADFVNELLGAKLREHPGYYGEMIWLMIMLEYWLRKHAADFDIS